MPEGSEATQSQATQNNTSQSTRPPNGAGSTPTPTPGWTSTLPEDIRSLPALTRYKDLPTFARSHLALEKQMGGRVSVPGPEASDADWDNFNAKLRPESADKYSFKPDEIAARISESMKLDKGMLTLNEDFVKGVREAFHKAGVSDRAASSLAEFYLGAQAQALQAEVAKINEGVETLKKDYGHAYEGNIEVANRAISRLASDIPGLDEAFEDPRIGSNPALVRLFVWLGQQMGEDTSVTGGERPSEEDAAQIKDKIAAMRNDPNHPLNQDSHPDHKRAVEQMKALYEQLEPDDERRPRR